MPSSTNIYTKVRQRAAAEALRSGKIPMPKFVCGTCGSPSLQEEQGSDAEFDGNGRHKLICLQCSASNKLSDVLRRRRNAVKKIVAEGIDPFE
jgi:hypothetical protein